ncbi:MAG: c-type cytochrome [Anaerolineae bacterium]
MLLGTVFVGMPLALGHRNDLPLERLYGDLAVGIASRSAAALPNPVAGNSRALETGRNAYTGSCGVCHGANGDGNGTFGMGLYPPASDLRGHDTQEKTDGQLFWIIKNGLSFAGMPGFADKYDDQTIWAMVAYTRALGNGSAPPAAQIPAPTPEQLAVANPAGDTVGRGAAIYFAQGCQLCHGAVGNAPGQLGLRDTRELQEAVRQGRRGMPHYSQAHVSDTQLNDLVAYVNTFPSQRR